MKNKNILYLPGYYVREHHLGLALYAREAGWILDASMVHFGKIPEDWDGDGIITMSADRDDIIEMVSSEKRPVVELFNGSRLTGYPHVCIDNLAIGRMAGHYLVSQGFQDIGYFHYDPEIANASNERERSEGLRLVVEQAGRQFHQVHFQDCIQQIRQLPTPLALMAQNDLVGDWLMHRLVEAGIQVPQEVAIIGVDSDRIYNELSPVAQTVVASQLEYQGYAAAALLDRLMKGEPVPSKPIMIEPERVIERSSTSLLVSEHPELNKALAYMRDRLGEKIEISSICEHVGLSRHQLNSIFKQFSGESLSRYLLILRINRARQILAETDDKIHALAIELGFGSAAYFSTVFLQETGLSPGEFRHRAHIKTRRIER
ncbi:substrate-binding domain-containing protein [Verrucomicrobiaceae bacterium N1E253]|uniref:Substrate-binding domain-containing protein n=1 Tax=Oceaniferula marina TaxID=2748318 RepID=A0A851GJV9_9BACT|nr:substrate-binding domain-containing protein [Oceaniferula marina]NWK57302.1 substrate-binding domain-containing protein [Oceaniferula marina]